MSSWPPPAIVVKGFGVDFVSPSTTTVYLTGVSSALTRAVAVSTPSLGLLVTPASGLSAQIGLYGCWAADNGCFTKGAEFDADHWIRWLDGLPRSGCLFACCPDVVGDARATLERSTPWLARVREAGFPAALVAQDGLREEDVPWSAIDCLFVGGTTDYKLSSAAASLTEAARLRGKWVHYGRVNSWKRLRYCAAVGADSCDGTYLAYGPDVNGPKLIDWLSRLDTEQLPAAQAQRFRRTAGADGPGQVPGSAGVTYLRPAQLQELVSAARAAERALLAGEDSADAVAAVLQAARLAFRQGVAVTSRRSHWGTGRR